jgi:hypothetical protein
MYLLGDQYTEFMVLLRQFSVRQMLLTKKASSKAGHRACLWLTTGISL